MCITFFGVARVSIEVVDGKVRSHRRTLGAMCFALGEPAYAAVDH